MVVESIFIIMITQQWIAINCRRRSPRPTVVKNNQTNTETEEKPVQTIIPPNRNVYD